MKRKIAVEVISFLFIVLFVYAALNKLWEYEKFTIQIGQSPLLTGFGGWLPWLVIGTELLVAGMLITRRYQKIGLYGSFVLMVMFTIYIAAILNLGSFVPCSCGGVLENLGWTEHLVFNSGFVLLALAGILLYRDDKQTGARTVQRKAVTLSGSLISSMAVMAGLIFFSGVLRDKRGSFLRLFPSHPVLEDRSFDIKYNSYYIAGAAKHHVYLGNTSSPLHMLVLNTVSGDSQHVKLNIEGVMDQKFWSLRIAVDSPYYYAYDGAVPRIYKGNVADWHATRFVHDEEYFLDLVPIGENSFFIKSLDGQTSESMLGTIATDSPYYRFDRSILEKQVDGFFCTDGTMLYSPETSKLIYLYRYRNEFLVLDTSLHKVTSHHTIDTISIAKVKIATLAGGSTRKMAAPPLTVNKRGTTYQHQLFVQSDLMAKNEHRNAHKKASVMDIYSLPEGDYQFSFYIYDFAGTEPLRQFRICDHTLVAMFDTHVQTYKLRENFFPIPYKENTRVLRRKTEHL